MKSTEAKDKTILVPDDFKKVLVKNKLFPYFESLAYSHRKEYVTWINDAKKVETRKKRMNSAVDKLSQKQGLNDKYKKKSNTNSNTNILNQ